MPSWYLDQGHVDHGYALTGHKAQGVTTGRAFTVIDTHTDREWAYVALSRGRRANTLYLVDPRSDDKECTHLTHPAPRHALDRLTASLTRSATQTAAIDHYLSREPSDQAGIDALGPAPPSSQIRARMDWLIARRKVQRRSKERRPAGIELIAGR